MVKGNKGASCQQSINETVTSQIHKRQGKMPYVNYQLCNLGAESEDKLGCLCENFIPLKRFPYNDNGKIDRKSLEHQYLS